MYYCVFQFFSMGVSSVFTLLLCGTTTFPYSCGFRVRYYGPHHIQSLVMSLTAYTRIKKTCKQTRASDRKVKA